MIRDQFICVSTTKTFISSSQRQREVDIKANWARTRNTYGDQATDIRVNSTVSSFPQSADPFGPPLLTLDDQNQFRPLNKPPPAPFYRRLAIEQPVPTSAVVNEVTTSSPIIKDSSLPSDSDEGDDDSLNSEIERITNEKNNEDGNSPPITPRFQTKVKSPFSQLFNTEPAPKEKTTAAPSMIKSDSDEDEFIAMLKRK